MFLNLNFYLLLLDTDEEKDQFVQIYNTYRNLMYYVARKILKDDYLAEDAVHNAFLKIIKHLEKLGDLHCHKTKNFLVIIVENTAKDIYNKQKRNNVFLDSLETELPNDKNLEDDILNHLEAYEIVKEIQLIPEIYRDVLMLPHNL